MLNALKESEEKYRLLAENATDVIWILDLESEKFKYVSPSVERLRGYTVEETMQQSAKDAMTIESYQKVQKMIPERIEKFLSGNIEFYFDEVEQQHKDGHIVYTEITSRYLMNNINGKIEIMGVSRDISERKKADEKIKKLSDHYQALIEKATDGIVLLDKEGNFKYISPTAKRIFGYQQEETITGNPSEFTHPDDLQMVVSHLMKVLEDDSYVPTIQYRYKNKKGEWQWVESIFSNLLKDPSVESIVLNFRDITERKIAEDKIIKLSRIYSFISQINQSIIHIKDINDLFTASCRIAVEFGKFRMVWIGKIDPETEYLIPVSYYGFEEGYLSDININSISLDASNPVNQGPSGSAIRNGKSFYCNDIENDPVMSIWKDNALKRGYRSVISLPIKKSGLVIGVYSLYSDTPFFFNKEELALLQDVTNDIGFAVDAIETRNERIKASEILKENEKQLREAQDLAHLGYWKWDVKTGQVEWSDEVYNIFRLDKDNFTPHIDSILALSPWPEDNSRGKELIKRAMETRKPGFYEQKFLRPDKSIGYYSSTFQGNFNEEGELISIIGTIMDITERKKAEIALQESEFFFRESQKAASIGSYKLNIQTGYWESSEVLNLIFGIDENYNKNIDGWLELIYLEDRELMNNYFYQEVIGRKTPFDKEYRIKRKSDGEVRWVLGLGKLETDNEGYLKFMIGTIQDITERKEVQIQINKLNEELEQRVIERTKELEDKNAELIRMNKLFVGRELRMVELKEKIKELQSKLK
jgi:PAS domain S-box-containing protein